MKEELLKILSKYIKKPKLETPPNSEFGDYCLPCFRYSKEPNKFAYELSQKIKDKLIERIEVKGPYVNFFLDKTLMLKNLSKAITSGKNRYGSTNVGKGKKILIEHTSINPNASPHVGRSRNGIIGDSIVKILRFQGYKLEVHYFVNDVGKQVAMLVYGSGKVDFDGLLKTYIKTNEMIKKNPKKEGEILQLLYKLEKGDAKIKARFKKIVDVCLKGQVKILSELGIKYDKFDYESKYLWNKDLEKILDRLKKTGKVFIDEEGRTILNQEKYPLAMKSKVLVLTRADGTSLYALRDMLYNIEKMKQGENIVVLGEDHKLYAQQIRYALESIGEKYPKPIFYSFISLAGKGAMSTRSGNVVLLSDFLKDAVAKAKVEIKKRKRATVNDKLAKMIAVSAVKYSVIKVSAEKEIMFDLDSAMNFEGDSGPYMQYSYSRACSILKRAGNIAVKNLKLVKKEEIELVKQLSKFKDLVLEASESLKPHLIANYCYELSQKFNEFYHSCNCIKEKDKDLKSSRLLLVKCFKQVLKNGLDLIGIESPECM